MTISKLGQLWNPQAYLYFPYARLFKKELAMPHRAVRSIASLNPQEFVDAGFKGIIFDKDNTLTAPYALKIFPGLEQAVASFKASSLLLAIMSNSAGTKDDKNYEDAETIRQALGISVLVHQDKKPGGFNDVQPYFGCKPHELVMIGDRMFTDIVFGNRYGLYTIHVGLLTKEGDLGAMAKARQYELQLMKKWAEKGITSPEHPLLK